MSYMNRTLGNRNQLLGSTTYNGRNVAVEIKERMFSDGWDSAKYTAREFLDFTCAISGDDLARINAFERKVEPRLWADVTTHTVRAAA